MNTLETKNFVDKVKKGISKEYITELIDAYLLSDRPANTLNAFDNIVADATLASFPDRRQLEAILSELLNAHILAGGNPNSFSTMMLSNSRRISFNAADLNMTGDKVERANRFGISVSGSNLFAVLTQVLSKAKEVGYNFDIDIPIMRDLDQGIIDTINLYCSSKDLGKTIEFLNSLGEEFTSKLSNNSSKTMLFSPAISYDTFNPETGKWSKDVLGETLVAGIDNVISKAVENATIQVTVEDANYYNNEHDMTASYLYMKDRFDASNVDFYGLVTEAVKEALKSMEIDLSNIYMPKSFIKNLYLVNNAVPQVTSPTGFVAASVIPTKAAQITFDQSAPAPSSGIPGGEEPVPGHEAFDGTPVVQGDQNVVGADDIPDLPKGFTPIGDAGILGQSSPTSGTNDLNSNVQKSDKFIKGPEMMLIPEMLERHHDDKDIEGLYQAFSKIRHSETQISSKIMQLNQFWSDLTYADFVAFRQYDQKEEFITDSFIQLWVTTKQGDVTPTVSSEELYKTIDNPEMAAAKKVLDAVLPEPPAPAPAPMPGEPAPVAPALSATAQVLEGGQPSSEPQLMAPPAPANNRSSKTARVMELLVRGPQLPPQNALNGEAPAGDTSLQTGSGESKLPDGQVGSLDQLPVQGENGLKADTGMYKDAPVEVQPLEGQGLTAGEAQAMINVGTNQQVNMDLSKYSFFPNPEVTLAQPVVDLDGSTITLYDYLEKYNVLGIIPGNSTIVTPEGTMAPDNFIVNNLARYVVTNGAIGIDEYMELFNISINAKEEKKGFLNKILGRNK